MRKFRFRLQTVLDQRKAIEDKLLAELGALRYREHLEIERLEELQNEREQLWERVTDGSASVSDLKDADAYACALTDDIGVQILTIESVREQILQKMNEVIEASKERKLIEKLREKHMKDYEREVAALEQKALDDAASVRYAREAV